MKKAVFVILIALVAFNMQSFVPNLVYAQDAEPEPSFETMQNSPDISLPEEESADLPISEPANDDIIPPNGQNVTPQAAGDYAPEYFEVQPAESGYLYISNLWTSDINVYVNTIFDRTIPNFDSLPPGNNAFRYYSYVSSGDIIRFEESIPNVTFRHWNNCYSGFYNPPSFLYGVPSAITYMPPMSNFTLDEAGTTVGNCFFTSFNAMGGSLTYLPNGSFDTSIITTVGHCFFCSFNDSFNSATQSLLTTLPAGSFDTSNITGTVGDMFFSNFNAGAPVQSLPADSFRLDKISETGDRFFQYFNSCNPAPYIHKCEYVNLPDNSFNTEKITNAEDGFFEGFNESGKLTKGVNGVKIKVPYNYSYNSPGFCWFNGAPHCYTGGRNYHDIIASGEIFDSYATPSSTLYYHAVDHFGQRTIGDNYDMLAEIDGADIDFITLIDTTTYELIPPSAYTLSNIGVATFITLNAGYILANHDDVGLHTFIAFYNDGYSSDLINLSVIPKAISPPSGGGTDEVSPVIPAIVVPPTINTAGPTINPAPADMWLPAKSSTLSETGLQIATALLVIMLLVWGGAVGNKCHIQNNRQNRRF